MQTWPSTLEAAPAGEGPLQEVAVIHTLAEVPGSRALLHHNATRADGDASPELFEGGSLADVVAAASAAAPQQVPPSHMPPHTMPSCDVLAQLVASAAAPQHVAEVHASSQMYMPYAIWRDIT